MSVVSREEYLIALRADLRLFAADLAVAATRIKQFAATSGASMTKAANPFATLNQFASQASKNYDKIGMSAKTGLGQMAVSMSNSEKSGKQMGSSYRSLWGHMKSDLQNFSGVFVRRLTFTFATTIQNAVLAPLRWIREGIRFTIQTGKDFEDAMLRTAVVAAAAVTDVIQPAFEQLTETARTLARETVFTATQLATAMYELVSVGLTVPEVQDAIAASAAFAAAAQTDLSTATDILTQIMKAFGLSSEDLGDIADGLVFSIATTTLNIDRLKDALKFSAPAAAAAGVGISDMMAVVAGFVDVTKQGGISGRAFRFMIQALLDPSTEAAKRILELGLRVRDLDPLMRPLPDILRTLAFSFFDAGDSAVIFGRRAGPVVAQFITSFRASLAVGIDSLQQFSDRWKNSVEGNLSVATYEALLGSLTNRYKLFFSKVTDLSLLWFFSMKDTLVRWIDLASEKIDWMIVNFDRLKFAASEVKAVLTGLLQVLVGYVAFFDVFIPSLMIGLSWLGLFKNTVLEVGWAFRAFWAIVKGFTLIGVIWAFRDAYNQSFIMQQGLRDLGHAFTWMAQTAGRAISEDFEPEWNGFVDMVFWGLGKMGESIAWFAETMTIDIARTVATIMRDLVAPAFQVVEDALHNMSLKLFAASMQMRLLGMGAAADMVLGLSHLAGGIKAVDDTTWGWSQTVLDAADNIDVWANGYVLLDVMHKAELKALESENEVIRAAAAARVKLREQMLQEISDRESYIEVQEAILQIYRKNIAEGLSEMKALQLVGDQLARVRKFHKLYGDYINDEFFGIMGRYLVESGTLAKETQAFVDALADVREELNKLGDGFVSTDLPFQIKQSLTDGLLVVQDFMVQDWAPALKRLYVGELLGTLVEGREELIAAALPIDVVNSLYGAEFQEIKRIYEEMGGDFGALQQKIRDEMAESTKKGKDLWTNFFDSITKGMGDAIAQMIFDGTSFGEFIERLFKGLAKKMIVDTFGGLLLSLRDKFFGPAEKQAEGFVGVVQGWFTKLLGSGGTVEQVSVEASVSWGTVVGSTGEMVQATEEGMGMVGKIFLGVGSAVAGYAATASAGWKGAIVAIGSAIATGFATGGPIGAAIAGVGAAIGSIIGFFTESAEEKFEKLAKTVVFFYANMGTLSLELGGKIAKSSESIGIFASRVLHMGAVMEEIGVTTENFSRYAGQLVQLFYDLDSGVISTSQATKILDDAFGLLVEQMKELGITGDASVIRFLKEVRERGLEIPSVLAFIGDELAGVAEGLEKLLAVHGPLFDLWLEKTEAIAKILADAREENRELTEEEAEQIHELQKEIEVLIASGGDLTAEYERLGIITLTVFNEMIANGSSVVEAMDAIAPSLDELVRRQQLLGIEGDAAFNKLIQFRSLVQTNRELVDGFGGLTQVMAGLNNIGAMNLETFELLTQQGSGMYEELTAAGFDHNQALGVMAGYLTEVRDTAAQYGYELSDATQELIDQAEEAGIITEAQRDMHDIMEDVVNVLKDIRDGFGFVSRNGQDAFRDISEAGQGAYDDLRTNYGNLWDEMEDGWGDMGRYVDDTFQGMDDAGREAARRLSGYFGAYEDDMIGNSVFPDVRKGAVKQFKLLRQYGQETAANLTGFFTDAGATMAASLNYSGLGDFSAGDVSQTAPAASMAASISPNQIAKAVAEALSGANLGGSDMTPVVRPTIQVFIGNREVQGVVAKIVGEGTLNGDISVHQDGVFPYN